MISVLKKDLGHIAVSFSTPKPNLLAIGTR